MNYIVISIYIVLAMIISPIIIMLLARCCFNTLHPEVQKLLIDDKEIQEGKKELKQLEEKAKKEQC